MYSLVIFCVEGSKAFWMDLGVDCMRESNVCIANPRQSCSNSARLIRTA